MRRIFCGLLFCVLLAGCTPLLERTYCVAEPHSRRFWESEAAGTLRAENYQDIVNDLLLLIGQHTEDAVLRLYNFESDLTVADTLEKATTEIQQETPMGAYAVEYITASSHAQRGYYEVSLRISYRRTQEQLQAVVNATSPEALYSLLAGALDDGPDAGGGYYGAAPGGTGFDRAAHVGGQLLSRGGKSWAGGIFIRSSGCHGKSRERAGRTGRRFGGGFRRRFH